MRIVRYILYNRLSKYILDKMNNKRFPLGIGKIAKSKSKCYIVKLLPKNAFRLIDSYLINTASIDAFCTKC